MAQPIAGWYSDPQNAAQQRWWDGTAWTNHVQMPPPPAPPVVAAPAVFTPTGDILPAAAAAIVAPAAPVVPVIQQWSPAPPAPIYQPPLPPGPVGYMPPQQPILQSRSYSAPLSFIGSTRRIIGWAQRFSSNTAAAIFAWTGAICFIPFAWAFVTLWYLVVFGLFGIFTFPYRLVRRSQRKNTHLAQAHLAATQAMLYQQQQRQQWR